VRAAPVWFSTASVTSRRTPKRSRPVAIVLRRSCSVQPIDPLRIESPGDLEYLMGSGKAFELLLAEEGKAQVAGIGREIVKC
jgi:hypothetical protein